MAIANTNSIIRAYLVTCGTLTGVLADADSIYCPRLPENATLPAVSFFTRGGVSTPYIPGLLSPSVQFDCWADNPITARDVYNKLYDNLQGIQDTTVSVSGTDYKILSAIEEVQGQDLQDADIPQYYRVLTYFRVMIRAEP